MITTSGKYVPNIKVAVVILTCWVYPIAYVWGVIVNWYRLGVEDGSP